jgi:type II secretory pathway pseudopilin PulG
MFNPVKKLKNKKGFALVTTYMAITVLLAFAGFVVEVSNSQNRTANVFKRQAQAIGIAEAGLDRALIWIRAQPIPPGSSVNPWGGPQNMGTPAIGSYSVTITDLGSPGGVPSVKRYRVTSTGTVSGVTQVLTNYLQTDNYARYIWFTDSESYGGTNVWFWDQDRLNGPTHTNGHFNIKGDPVFAGEVRSVDSYIRYYNNGNNINSANLSNSPYDLPDFQSSVTLGAESTNMPTQALSLRSASTSAGGLRLSGNSTIVLNANGTMNVTNSARGWNNHNMALPTNGALFVNNGSLTISGTLNGRLTAGSSRDIIIPSNVLYANDPRIDPASTDTLGLISEEDVMITSGAPHNLEIDGSIMALNTSFMLNNWWVGPAKGTLTVFGGIIQDERGPVGTFSGTTKVSGYSKNYEYDTRLLNSPPPFVPTTGDYITLSWEN